MDQRNDALEASGNTSVILTPKHRNGINAHAVRFIVQTLHVIDFVDKQRDCPGIAQVDRQNTIFGGRILEDMDVDDLAEVWILPVEIRSLRGPCVDGHVQHILGFIIRISSLRRLNLLVNGSVRGLMRIRTKRRRRGKLALGYAVPHFMRFTVLARKKYLEKPYLISFQLAGGRHFISKYECLEAHFHFWCLNAHG